MNKNKIALVTGGSRGLGRDMALQLAQKGLDVVITFNSNKAEAEKVVAAIEAQGKKSIALQLDVENSNNFEAFVKNVHNVLRSKFETEKFDFLINNAGVATYASFADTTEAQFDSMLNIHLKAPFFLTQKLALLMNDNGGIINISSGLARFTTPGYDAYATMKGAVETLTKYQAKHFGSRKIRVNVVAPGAIETDFGGGVVRDNEKINTNIASNTALGRVGLADDIGGVVAFLCSHDAKWINAQRIEVSGGINI